MPKYKEYCSHSPCAAVAVSGLKREYADGKVCYFRFCPVHAHGANILENWKDKGLVRVTRIKLGDIPARKVQV